MTSQKHTLADEVIDGLRKAVGTKHVLTTASDLDRYSRCTIPWQSSCAAVIFPGNADEVAKVTPAARQQHIADFERFHGNGVRVHAIASSRPCR